MQPIGRVTCQNPAMAPIMFAHRGARIDFPENTMPAFAAGLAAGATGLESDAWVCGDGEVVLAHDRTVGRLRRRLNVREASAAQLGEFGVPRLIDVYRELGCEFEFSIDAKHRKVIEPMLAIAKEFGALERLWLCYPEFDTLVDLRSATTAKLVHSCPKDRLGDGGIERHAHLLQVGGIDAMNFRHTEWTAGLVALFHRFDVKVFAWDVQEERHLREMTRIGIDGLYCDRPERMVAVAAQLEQ